MVSPLQNFLRDELQIVKRVEQVDENDFGRPKYMNETVVSLSCLFDPKIVRSREDREMSSRPHSEKITFFTDYNEEVKETMFVLYKNKTYRILYVDHMKSLSGIGDHSEIATERTTNI